MRFAVVFLCMVLGGSLACFPETKPKEDMFVRLIQTNNAGFKSYETNKVTFKMVRKCVKRLKKYKLSESEMARLRIRNAPFATCKKGSTTISYRVPNEEDLDQNSLISIYDKSRKLDVRVYFNEIEQKLVKIEDRSVLYDGEFDEEIIDLTIEYLGKVK